MLSHADEMPYLNFYPLYPFQREFIETDKQFSFLMSPNQVGKTTCSVIRHLIYLLTPHRWETLFPDEVKKGTLPFAWSFLPSSKISDEIINQKWVELLPPQDGFGSDLFRWKFETEAGKKIGISFGAGQYIGFKFYSQKKMDLQSSSLWWASCDEEINPDIISELFARIQGTWGKFWLVFTATQNYEHWIRALLPDSNPRSLYPGALKKKVSIPVDCMTFEDGKPSHWAKPSGYRDPASGRELNRVEYLKLIYSDAEYRRRVLGENVIDENLKYYGFDKKMNMMEPHIIPKNWKLVSGVDIGSGHKGCSSTAITFCAVNKDLTKVMVVFCERMDDETTTALDAIKRYIEIKRKHFSNYEFLSERYDYSSADFKNFAKSFQDVTFEAANKDRVYGERLINVLFRAGAMKIFEGCEERDKLVLELETIKDVDKRELKTRDDLTDSLLYALSKLPFDMQKLKDMIITNQRTFSKTHFDDFKNEKTYKNERDRSIEEFRKRRSGLDKKTDDILEMEQEYWANEYEENLI